MTGTAGRVRTSAHVAVVAAAAFSVLLGVLHLLEPQFNTGGHLISEYELGRQGWLMSVCFVCMAVASGSLAVALRRHLSGAAGRVGWWWLVLIALAYAGASVFYPDESTGGLGLPPDPADWKRAAVAPTLSASLHGLCGVVIIFTSPIAYTLVHRGVARAGWLADRGGLRVATTAVWVGFVLFPLSLVAYQTTPAPTDLDLRLVVSVTNRVMVLVYAVWTAYVASRVALAEAPLPTAGAS